MPAPLTLAKWTAAVAAASAVFVAAGYFGGRHTAEGALERLQLVWPNFQSLDQEQRVLLAKIAIECELHQVDATIDPVVRCLRDGAQALDRRHAPDFRWVAGLEASLKQTPAAAPKQKE